MAGKKRGRKWDELSSSTRRREPWCRLCLAAGRFVPSVASDHIVPIAMGGSVLDPANVQPLCAECHAAKTTRDQQAIARARGPNPARLVIVDHPPGAPVSAWVRSRWAEGDVLASGGEYDRMLERLGASEAVNATGCALWVDRLEREANR